MSLVPDPLLELYEAASDRQLAWVPLADWAHEELPHLRGARPPRRAELHLELELVSELPRRMFLEWKEDRPAGHFELEGVLRAEASTLVDELRVASAWPASRAMVFGLRAQPQQSPPEQLLPALLDAALASAPGLLRRFEVWIPKNPPWGPRDDCQSQLEPLTTQRPPRAQHLVLRAPRKGMVELVRRAAANRWRTITLAAPLDARDLAHLSATADAQPDVELQVIDATRRGAVRPNLHFVDDPDACELEVNVRGRVTRGVASPGRMLDVELQQALLDLGVEFVTDLGLNALRALDTLKLGAVRVAGRTLLEPFFLRDVGVDVTCVRNELELQGHVRRVR